jgi:hypothetical protein
VLGEAGLAPNWFSFAMVAVALATLMLTSMARWSELDRVDLTYEQISTAYRLHL